jgi:hypothetical protein
MADWLELRALLDADQSASAADLRQTLVALGGDAGIGTGSSRAVEGSEERLVIAAFAELADRARACGDAYPFVIEGSVVRAKDELTKHWAYIFCLLLSFEYTDGSEGGRRATELFEEVAEISAREYVSGKSLKFGFPRRVLPRNFIAALTEVCGQLGEGRGARDRPSAHDAKDARLDIVAWRAFPDGRPGQLILFGQCAAGGNWETKISDLQPRNFTDLYWVEPPYVDPVKAFFTPFRLPLDNWDTRSKYGGIIFERCRVSYLAWNKDPPADVAKWNTEALETLKG